MKPFLLSALLLLAGCASPAPDAPANPAPEATGQVLGKVLGDFQRDREREEAKSREEYLGSHPELSDTMVVAILNHTALAGMTLEQAKISFGGLQFAARSDGVGGSAESWYARNGPLRYTLYFADGVLVRWTTVPFN